MKRYEKLAEEWGVGNLFSTSGEDAYASDGYKAGFLAAREEARRCALRDSRIYRDERLSGALLDCSKSIAMLGEEEAEP